MKIHARPALVVLAAVAMAGCGRSITGPADTSIRPAPAQHVDNPAQTPMKD
jgi:hypothetical protein